MRIEQRNTATYTADRCSYTQHVVYDASKLPPTRRNPELLHDEDRWHDGWLIVALAGFLAANFVDQTLLFWAHHWCIVHPTLHGAIVMLALCAGMRTAIWLQKRGERL